MTACLSPNLPDAPLPGTVLVVDDDELVREHLAIHLQRAGYAVATADCGQQALEQISMSHCEAVIADWEMPGMDGLSLCRRIRGQWRDSQPYFLMFTIRGDTEDVVKGLHAGADDYIVKGSPMAVLLARLASGRRRIAERDALLPGPSRLESLSNVYRTAERPNSPRHLPNLAFALAREYEQCRGRQAPISLLLCAPDGVAALEDCLGAQVSAAFLDGLRAEVPKHLLESEWVARCGCEGFVVVLPDTGLEAAQRVAHKIRMSIAAAASNLALGTEPLAMTVSVGLASIDDGRYLQRLTPADMLRASEQCLAQSRRDGGDRVTVAQLLPQ